MGGGLRPASIKSMGPSGPFFLRDFDFHYLIGTPHDTEHLVEHHELGLFEQAEAFSAADQALLQSLKMFLRLGGKSMPSLTEKQRPCACSGP